MSKYRTSEVTPAKMGRDQAEMLGELIGNLKKKGVRDDLIEKIAVNISGAASSWLDGCKGTENPADLVTTPMVGRGG